MIENRLPGGRIITTIFINLGALCLLIFAGGYLKGHLVDPVVSAITVASCR